MTISVKFFASLRERVGQSEVELTATDRLTIDQVWSQSTADMIMPENTLCAINMEYVNNQAPVSNGDEVAFFPPVSGGSYGQ